MVKFLHKENFKTQGLNGPLAQSSHRLGLAKENRAPPCIVKIVESEVDFRVLHSKRQHESRYAAYMQDAGTRTIFSESFSPIRSTPT